MIIVFQLVMQFRPWGNRSLDDLIALEDALIALEHADDAIDGHDIGSDETNIFIFTSDPTASLGVYRPIVEYAGLMSLLAAGFRESNVTAYARAWPTGDTTEFLIR